MFLSRRSFYFVVLLLGAGLAGNFLMAQQLSQQERVQRHVLIQLAPELDPQSWLKTYTRQYTDGVPLFHLRKLGIRRNIHLFHAAAVVDDDLLRQIRSVPGVVGLQRNGFVEFRRTPNDPLYSSQWHLARIGLPKVWNQSIGGLTADGDTIVVAIMDSGFEIYHEDMVDNLWINHGEIAADSIDNDGNGYIDDLHGWDYFSDTPRIAPGLHGLGAAGIIGARGNNALGLSGVNWQVKLMYFSFRRIDHLIAAFEYVIDQRALYNESNGSRGSFVVAVNNSFGVENIFCDPPANAVYELWRDSYDAMGEVGILAAVSPANLSHNVDRFGDMPATCRSEYMIAACNTNEDDNLSGTASFGPESVDLAAPGDGSRSTAPNNSYGGYGQNSAAAPHVAGAIALLYSLPCAPLGYQARTAPSATALGIRNALLQGVEPLASLEGKTVTGGLLQVANSWEMMREIWCSNQPEELQIRKLYPNPTSGHPLRLEYLTPENGTFYLEFYNALGQLVRHTSIEIARSGPHLSSVPVDQLPSGVYILRFGQGDNWVIQRVVVAR